MKAWHERLVTEAWQTDAPEKLALELLQRTVDASRLSDGATDRAVLQTWTSAMASTLVPELKKQFDDRWKQAASWTFTSLGKQLTRMDATSWPQFAGEADRDATSATRLDPGGWPTWNQLLERYSGSSDRTSAAKPRVGELESGLLSYHPAVYRGRVYLNELNRIVAYDLKSGLQWPESKPPLPLFDSHIAPAALLPIGYPLVGAARGTVVLHDDCLYARIGSPVTGWSNGERAGDGGSISYIVGIDLQRQGSLLRGFPLHLSQFDFDGGEPEGCPVVMGDKLIVTVAKRDNVGLRRSVAAFDRFSGELIWKSPVLANGSVEGTDRANLLVASTANARQRTAVLQHELGIDRVSRSDDGPDRMVSSLSTQHERQTGLSATGSFSLPRFESVFSSRRFSLLCSARLPRSVCARCDHR